MRSVLLSFLVMMAACSADMDSPPVVKRLAQGAEVSGVNGIHFGPDGRLYAASVLGSEIVVVDPETGHIEKRFGSEEGVYGPDDVAFSAEGDWYWTSILSGEVAGFRASGERVVAAQLTPGVNPLTFSDDGRLFVSQCFFGTNLYEVDPLGEQAPRLIADDLGPGCGLNGMDWGPDGRLYGPRWFTGEIVSYDVDSGERRLVAEGFDVPAAVKFDGQGRLHVLDTARGTVNRLDANDRTVVATLTPGLDNFAFDEDDRLFVSSFVDGFIVRVAEEGAVTELLPGGIAHPGGVAVMDFQGKATAFVADLHSLRGFDLDSGEQVYVQQNILGVGELGSVLSVATHGDRLILSAFTDNSVRLWDPSSNTVVRRWDNLAAPVDVVSYNGKVAVALHGAGAVVLLGEGEPVVLADDLASPSGLAVLGEKLFVTDRSTGRVLRIGEGGEPVAPQVVAQGLDKPEGVQAMGGALIVFEGESGRIKRIDDGVATEIASVPGGTAPNDPHSPPSMIFNDLAVWADSIVATSETERSLYRIDL